MNSTNKYLLLSLLAILVVGYVTGVAVWSSRRMTRNVCHAVKVLITDKEERQYVDEKEIVSMLKKQGIYPLGKPLVSMSVQRIEDAVIAHPMVREAECYTLSSGALCIRLCQRVPVLRVVTADDTYFVDSDRLRMPVRESVTADVLTATGAIGERLACKELSDIAIMVGNDQYWHDRIARIHVVTPNYVYLVQQPDGTRLILGKPEGIERKLAKLRKLYDNVFDQIGWRTYDEIDLRFHGQIVGRNN